MDGVVRAWGDAGAARHFALLEVALSVVFFACAVTYARLAGVRD
jgi:uncharacterized membrane protein